MIRRAGAMWILATSALCLSACGKVNERPNRATLDTGTPTNVQKVTLHVPGMIDRQGIT
jgi:hypothetical protein